MKPDFDDELLSAYLDDELSEAERARVEQVLAQSPDSRELLEELRALRGTLGELPKHQVPSEFTAQVLAQTERKSTAAPPAASNGQASMLVSDTSFWRRLQRPLLYAGLVAAAAVLIMLYAPDDPVEIAVNEPPPRGGVNGAAELEGRQLDRDRQPSPADGYESPRMAARALESLSADNAVELRDSSGDGAGVGGAVSKQYDADGVSTFAAGAPAPPREDESLGIVAPVANAPALAERQAALNIDDAMLIVTCEVSPEALRQRSFEQILVSQRIAIEDNQAGQGESDVPANYRRFQVPPDSPESPSASPRDEQLGRTLAHGVALQEMAQVTDVVYVEAETELLQNTLARLSAQPDKFLHVAVEPTSEVQEAQKWRNYSYGEGASEGRVYRENQSLVEKLAETEEVAAGQSVMERAEFTLSQRPTPAATEVDDDSRSAQADAGATEPRASKAAAGRSENANRALGGVVADNTSPSPASGATQSGPISRGRAVRLTPESTQFAGARNVNEQSRADLNDRVAEENKTDDGRSTLGEYSARPEAATRLHMETPAQIAGAQSQSSAPRRALFVFKLSPPSATAGSAPATDSGDQR